jgi:hypothetical protein
MVGSRLGEELDLFALRSSLPAPLTRSFSSRLRPNPGSAAGRAADASAIALYPYRVRSMRLLAANLVLERFCTKGVEALAFLGRRYREALVQLLA